MEDQRTISSGSELAASGESISHEPFKEDGIQVCSCKVDSSCMSRWSRSDDHLHRRSSSLPIYGYNDRLLTTLECILELCGTTPFCAVVGAIFFGLRGPLGVEEVEYDAIAAAGMNRVRVLKDESLRLERTAASTGTIAFIL